MAAAPVFYTIASLYYPGYNLTQRGSQIVAEAEDVDNPFQLWYKDDSWRYVEDGTDSAAFALINNGSKAALKADDSSASKVCLWSDYKHSKDINHTTLWTLQSSALYSVALQAPLVVGIGKSPPESGDGVVAILNFADPESCKGWNLKAYDPPAFIIQSNWVSQILVAKPPHTDATFANGLGSFNNELGVVAVHQNNKNGKQEVWYRVPATSPLEDSNSSFFVISKLNGKALKGSTKSGDKVILTEFDPLDDNFVWSEDRTFTIGQRFVSINLANSSNVLHWILPLDSEYQNAAYNHPLTLRQATSALDRSQWNFISVSLEK